MSKATQKRRPSDHGKSRGEGPRALSAAWRDGVQLVGTPVWCDARRRRDVCFASAHGRVGKAGHGQLIATPQTLALVGAQDAGHLGVPVRRRFSLGQLQLELLPSGHGLGAAALRAELGGRVALYAGAVNPVSVGLAEPGEVRPADVVIVAAPYRGAAGDFPPAAPVVAQLLEWVQASRAGNVLVLVNTELKALDVAAVLAGGGVEVCAPQGLRNLARRAKTVAAAVPDLRAIPRDRPAVVVATVEQRARLAPELARLGLVTGWVSGEAADPAAVAAARVERGFAWSSCANRGQLLSWIEATSAREIYLTGRGGPELAAHLGPRASALGPPTQMRLFPGGEP
ncbi:MAG: hypothetical protein R3B48_26635 [Kofleriaceae bacterium]